MVSLGQNILELWRQEIWSFDKRSFDVVYHALLPVCEKNFRIPWELAVYVVQNGLVLMHYKYVA